MRIRRSILCSGLRGLAFGVLFGIALLVAWIFAAGPILDAMFCGCSTKIAETDWDVVAGIVLIGVLATPVVFGVAWTINRSWSHWAWSGGYVAAWLPLLIYIAIGTRSV